MGTYTRRSEPEIDATIAGHVQRILAALTELAPAARAIYLGGGFGRGEGSVRPGDGRWIPLNDYDLIIVDDVTEEARAEGRKLGRRMAAEVGVDAIDLGWISPSSLSGAPLTMDNYDIRYGARLLRGEDLRSRMPDYPVGTLPIFELVRLLCNRAAGLLSATLPNTPVGGDYAAVQVIKAGMGVGDAIVAMHDQYDHLANVRLERFRRLESQGALPEWVTPAEAAFVISTYDAKLMDPRRCTEIEPTRLADLLVRAFRALVERESGAKCKELPDVEMMARRCFATGRGGLFRRFCRTLRHRHYGYFRGNHFEISRWVLLSQIALFEAQCRGDLAMQEAYRRHFWWVPGASALTPDAAGTINLWERYSHG